MTSNGSNGFTYAGATAMLGTVLGSTLYGKLHVADAEDGTMNPSSFVTRVPVNFGAPDSNGIYDLSAPILWGTFTVTEQVWGVSLWTAATAGTCRLIRAFSKPKNVFAGDTLKLATMPIGLPIVGL